jgi:SRSO17 transposase
MTPRQLEKLDQALRQFLGDLIAGMGRAERRESMELYVKGLLLDGERKSMEPMALRLIDDASEVVAMRQRLQECITVSAWDESKVYERIASQLERELPGVEALVIDDTSFPKKGKSSVGVARQYSGLRGMVDNCQVAVSLHLASEAGSGCIGFRLYLPEVWAEDHERRKKARIPDDVRFATKWELALGLLERARAWKVRRHVVLADAAYGEIQAFRKGLTQLGLTYVVGVPNHIALWPPGVTFRVPVREKPGRRCTVPVPVDDTTPLSIGALFNAQPRSAWRTVSWREGTRGRQKSRFCALRVRTAQRHSSGAHPGEEQWAIAQWPLTEDKPTRFYLSTLPATSSLRTLVRYAKLRWRVERDYQEMKGELGLDHFEGRSWRGFHHHVALCAAAHAFLTLQRTLFPPQRPTMDPLHGPPCSSTDPALHDRLVPALHAPGHAPRTSERAVENLIK